MMLRALNEQYGMCLNCRWAMSVTTFVYPMFTKACATMTQHACTFSSDMHLDLLRRRPITLELSNEKYYRRATPLSWECVTHQGPGKAAIPALFATGVTRLQRTKHLQQRKEQSTPRSHASCPASRFWVQLLFRATDAFRGAGALLSCFSTASLRETIASSHRYARALEVMTGRISRTNLCTVAVWGREYSKTDGGQLSVGTRLAVEGLLGSKSR